ncbi:MAG: DMT family transporter [Bdellovibrionales bacterium]
MKLSKNQSQFAVLTLLGSVVTFTFMTVGVKYLSSWGWPSFTLIWGRFALGFLVVGGYCCYKKEIPKPRNPKTVYLRAFTNFTAVSLFYFAISYTSLVKANLLNMSYLVFVGLLSPLFLNEKTSARQWLALIISLSGIYFLLGTEIESWNHGDIYGILCGIVAAASIMSLRAARKTDDSNTILFYVMGIGFIFLSPFFQFPEISSHRLGLELSVFAGISMAGLLGQYLLTISFKHITAVTASLIGSLRVLLSAVLGLLLFNEALTWNIYLGSILLLFGMFFLKPTKTKKIKQ